MRKTYMAGTDQPKRRKQGLCATHQKARQRWRWEEEEKRKKRETVQADKKSGTCEGGLSGTGITQRTFWGLLGFTMPLDLLLYSVLGLMVEDYPTAWSYLGITPPDRIVPIALKRLRDRLEYGSAPADLSLGAHEDLSTLHRIAFCNCHWNTIIL